MGNLEITMMEHSRDFSFLQVRLSRCDPWGEEHGHIHAPVEDSTLQTFRVTVKTAKARLCYQEIPHLHRHMLDQFLFLSFVFNPTVDQGGDRLRPVGHQRVQPSASGQPTCHQRQCAVREQVRFGRNGQLPERRGAWPSGAGPDSPYRYAGSQSVIVCTEGGGRVDKSSPCQSSYTHTFTALVPAAAVMWGAGKRAALVTAQLSAKHEQ